MALTVALILICMLTTAIPAARGNTDAIIAGILDLYVELSNQRDYEGLLSLYVEQPVIIRQGRTLDGPFDAVLKKEIAAWEEREALFEIEHIDAIDADLRQATASFSLRASGRVWFLRLSKSFDKKLYLTFQDNRWKIVRDDTL